MFDKLFGLDQPKRAEDGTELLTTVNDNIQLSMVRSLLEAESIPYLVRERGSGSAVKIVMGVSSFGSDVYVPASRCISTICCR